MAKRYVYSTLTCDCIFNLNDKKTILINGGANTWQKGTIFVKDGAATAVSDEEYDLLMALPESDPFKIQMKAGFLKIDSKMDIEKAVEDMEKRDKSAPIKKKDTKDIKENILQ